MCVRVCEYVLPLPVWSIIVVMQQRLGLSGQTWLSGLTNRPLGVSAKWRPIGCRLVTPLSWRSRSMAFVSDGQEGEGGGGRGRMGVVWSSETLGRIQTRGGQKKVSVLSTPNFQI